MLMRDSDLPALFRSADSLASLGQRTTKRYIRTELLLLILAGSTGITSFRIGPAQIDVLAVLGAILFVAALGVTTLRILRHPESNWYAGRAAAESVKTLAWRYAVGGDPFPQTQTLPSAEERFLNRLREILSELDNVALDAPADQAREITDAMRQLRARSIEDRRIAYLDGRIREQLSWYRRRSVDHQKSARYWLSAAMCATAVGLLAACLKAVGVIDIDLLGLAASCAASAIGWTQTNQHRNLATAYKLTAGELNIIRDRLDHTNPEHWALFVSDAEDAMSREHTMWLARHGHPSLPRR